MKSTVWVSTIKFKNGTIINLNKDSIVVFVGPNNSGKSQSLREIDEYIKSSSGKDSFVIDHLMLSNEGTSEGFLERIKNRKINGVYRTREHAINRSPEEISKHWDKLSSHTQDGYWMLSNFSVNNIRTIDRLNLVNPPANIDFLNEVGNHPIHTLKQESEKEQIFSEYFKLAFGEDVIVNHGAGSSIPMHVGKRPKATLKHDRVSSEYQKNLRELPLLNNQGDGMKSFAGVFLTLFAEDYPINLIDEPEAFLHPPQAALLGKMIAQKMENDKQLFIATHSEHFLKGLLDSAANRLTVIRIHRDNTISKTNILENKELKHLWNDSLLRHSNILDGLFHKKVILVESDSDSRFYNAIINAIIESENLSSPDILFVQSGGKHRFPTVIRALKKLEVPLTIIGDFDLYHNENPIKHIYEELGGKWDDIKLDFNKVKKAIDAKKPELEAAALKAELDSIFTSFTDKIIPEEKIKAIQAALKKSSPWSQAKASGKAYLPAGESILAFNRIQEKLLKKHIHILDIGEIEAFDKTVGGHGPRWVAQVLEKDLVKSTELEEARSFVKTKILCI